MAAGDSANVTVTFTPTTAGTKYDTLTIASNDPDSPSTKLVVNGTGTAPIFAFSTGSLANTRIAFSSRRESANPQLFVMGADGTNPVRLRYNSASEAGASMSPDGTKLASN